MQPDAHDDSIGNILAKTHATKFHTLGILQIRFEHTLAVNGFVLIDVTRKLDNIVLLIYTTACARVDGVRTRLCFLYIMSVRLAWVSV
jgi:hypothetical protein